MRYLALLALLTACGGQGVASLAPGEGGDSDATTSGLAVKANGVDVGMLLDVDESFGTWKVFSPERFVFHLDPETGAIGGMANALQFISDDCSGDPYIATLNTPVCNGALPGKLFAVVGENIRAGIAGTRVVLGDGSRLRAFTSQSRFTGSGCERNSGGPVCAQKAADSTVLPATLPLPITAD